MTDIINITKKIRKRTFDLINPLPSGIIDENLYTIKDNDSNYFIYKKDDAIIAIDSGYKNSTSQKTEYENLPFSYDDIEAFFLTHIDSDHAGCLYDDKKYSAKIYLHEKEKSHLYKKIERVKFGPFKIKHKLSTNKDITYFQNDNEINFKGIKIKPIHTPGHTLGHTCFFIDDKFLFTGDSLIFKNGIGYRFFDLLGFNNKQNSQSLTKLKEFALKNNCKCIYTSHTGYSNDIEKAFEKCDSKID